MIRPRYMKLSPKRTPHCFFTETTKEADIALVWLRCYYANYKRTSRLRSGNTNEERGERKSERAATVRLRPLSTGIYPMGMRLDYTRPFYGLNRKHGVRLAH